MTIKKRSLILKETSPKVLLVTGSLFVEFKALNEGLVILFILLFSYWELGQGFGFFNEFLYLVYS